MPRFAELKTSPYLHMQQFSSIPIDYSWSFSDKTIKDTSYITHGYYTYPAKFIPQLAARLMCEYSTAGDIIIDPFMGSGTTIVEALVNNRIGIGTDINDIAYLIAKVKTTPLHIEKLQHELQAMEAELLDRIGGHYPQFSQAALAIIPHHERIDYWFIPQQKAKLSIILARILELTDETLRNFFLVAFAQILKSCSIWLQKSVKPTRDQHKKVQDPLPLFVKQTRKMLKRHEIFNQLLSEAVRNDIDNFRTISCADSRTVPCADDAAQMIITSPPYVTSYEYADLHQLPSLWFGYVDELADFRKKFIGSAYTARQGIDLKSAVAADIIQRLGATKKGREVHCYFADMLETFVEMRRVLRVGGKACVVIGNTQFQGVDILNAEVFQEQFEQLGFATHTVIHREIPSKMLPSVRDSSSGKFVKVADKKAKLAYPTEYILIMEKL